MTMTSVTTVSGVPFTLRLVRKGDRYGRDFCLTHDQDEPLIEFYDGRYPHSEYGQLVSRYNVSTLLGDNKLAGCGLCLDGGVPNWVLDKDTLQVVVQWLREQAIRPRS
jgi:hypothetical protein